MKLKGHPIIIILHKNNNMYSNIIYNVTKTIKIWSKVESAAAKSSRVNIKKPLAFWTRGRESNFVGTPAILHSKHSHIYQFDLKCTISRNQFSILDFLPSFEVFPKPERSHQHQGPKWSQTKISFLIFLFCNRFFLGDGEKQRKPELHEDAFAKSEQKWEPSQFGTTVQ